MPLPTIDIPTIPPYRNLAPTIKYGYCLIVNSKAGYHLREQLMAALLDKEPMKALDALTINCAMSKDEVGTHASTYMREIYYDPFRYDATRALGGLLRLTEHAPTLTPGKVWVRYDYGDSEPGPWFRGPAQTDPRDPSRQHRQTQRNDFGLFDLYIWPNDDVSDRGIYVSGMPPQPVAVPSVKTHIAEDTSEIARRYARASVSVFRAYLKDGLEGAWTACEDMASGQPGLRYAINCESPFIDPSPTVQDDWRRAMILATKQIDTIDND